MRKTARVVASTTTINAALAETFDAAPEAPARPANGERTTECLVGRSSRVGGPAARPAAAGRQRRTFLQSGHAASASHSAVSAVAGVLLCLAFTTPAQAQSDFSRVNLKPGDFAYLTLPNGVEISGPLVVLTPTLISIDGRWFQPVPGLTIQRRGDSVWNGPAWGLTGGLIAGMLSASGECGLDWSTGRCIAAGGMWGIAIGALYDVVYVGRTTVFRAPNLRSRRSFQVVPAVGSASMAWLIIRRF